MSDMVNIPSTNTDPSYRYKMPKLQSKIEGRGNGIKTNIVNLKDIADAIHRRPEHVCKFFGVELCTKSSYTDKEREGIRATIMGNHDASNLQTLLDKYLNLFVLCETCGLPEIDMKVDTKKGEVSGRCAACGWKGRYSDAANSHKVMTLIVKLETDLGGSKKLSKEERKALRAEKAQKGNKNNDDDDSDDDDDLDDSDEVEDKKKKKKKDKKKKGEDDDVEDSDEKKKKEKR